MKKITDTKPQTATATATTKGAVTAHTPAKPYATSGTMLQETASEIDSIRNSVTDLKSRKKAKGAARTPAKPGAQEAAGKQGAASRPRVEYIDPNLRSEIERASALSHESVSEFVESAVRERVRKILGAFLLPEAEEIRFRDTAGKSLAQIDAEIGEELGAYSGDTWLPGAGIARHVTLDQEAQLTVLARQVCLHRDAIFEHLVPLLSVRDRIAFGEALYVAEIHAARNDTIADLRLTDDTPCALLAQGLRFPEHLLTALSPQAPVAK